MQKRDIQQLICNALQSINTGRDLSERLDTSPDASIYGRGSPLDSLGLVSVILEIEESLRERGVNISLSDERAMSQRHSPFRNVDALSDYIEQVIRQESA